MGSQAHPLTAHKLYTPPFKAYVYIIAMYVYFSLSESVHATGKLNYLGSLQPTNSRVLLRHRMEQSFWMMCMVYQHMNIQL